MTQKLIDTRVARLKAAGWEKGDDPDGEGEHYILRNAGLGIVTLGAISFVDDTEIIRLISLGHAELARRQAVKDEADRLKE
jgi:hypothetical protein